MAKKKIPGSGSSAANAKPHFRESSVDKSFYVIVFVFLLLCALIVAVPILNVISQSLSSPQAVIAGRVSIIPVDFTWDAYKNVFEDEQILLGYWNSIVYTVVGTLINIAMTVILAYPLSRGDFKGRGIITALFVFTMVFTAPLIPTYLTVKSYHLLDTIWAIVLPGAISVYNMIIARTFFSSSIPDEMIEAAELDGANDLQILWKLVLPLSKAVLAVLVLYYAVAHWNTYFQPMIYLSSNEKFPLQLILRNILNNAAAVESMATASADETSKLALVETLKYAIIVVGSLPVILLYPFVQKYFVKGVMIGSVKG